MTAIRRWDLPGTRGLWRQVEALLQGAVLGSIAGSVCGTGLLLGYELWRAATLIQVRHDPEGLAALLQGWVGQVPEASVLLLFPAAGLGCLAGMAAQLAAKPNRRRG